MALRAEVAAKPISTVFADRKLLSSERSMQINCFELLIFSIMSDLTILLIKDFNISYKSSYKNGNSGAYFDKIVKMVPIELTRKS